MGLKDKFLKKAQNFYHLGVWYPVADVKSEHQEFIEAVKHRIDILNDFEFNEDYTQFRRILTIHQVLTGDLDPDGKNIEMVRSFHDYKLKQILADPEISAKLEQSANERKNQYRR